jgi:hypothetical protein
MRNRIIDVSVINDLLVQVKELTEQVDLLKAQCADLISVSEKRRIESEAYIAHQIESEAYIAHQNTEIEILCADLRKAKKAIENL